nr:hypothetical protein [Kofleriaceae bacterium]
MHRGTYASSARRVKARRAFGASATPTQVIHAAVEVHASDHDDDHASDHDDDHDGDHDDDHVDVSVVVVVVVDLDGDGNMDVDATP